MYFQRATKCFSSELAVVQTLYVCGWPEGLGLARRLAAAGLLAAAEDALQDGQVLLPLLPESLFFLRHAPLSLWITNSRFIHQDKMLTGFTSVPELTNIQQDKTQHTPQRAFHTNRHQTVKRTILDVNVTEWEINTNNKNVSCVSVGWNVQVWNLTAQVYWLKYSYLNNYWIKMRIVQQY